MKNCIRFAFALPIVIALASTADSRAQDSGGAAEPLGRIVGKVVAADGKTEVVGAVVVAYHLSSERLFRSAPTTGKARYEISGLPYGYFDLAVETPDGLYVGEQVVNLAPASKAVVNLTVTPTAKLPLPARSALRPYPASEAEPIGLAQLEQKPLGREFWRSPKGIAILAGSGGAILLAIASGSNAETGVSPFAP